MHLLVDTDPGMGTYNSDPEDSFAITLAHRAPDVELVAVTIVQGNVPVTHGFANARHLLSLLDASAIELAAGSESPIAGPSGRPEVQRWLDEKDARPRVIPAAAAPYPGRSAVDVILENAARHDDLVVAAIGPLSNLAEAITRDPATAGRIRRVVIMGGTIEEPGNITPTAEFNFFMDPDAADVVLRSGLDITLVPLDACYRTSLTARDIDEHVTGTPLGAFVAESCAAWLDTMRGAGHGGLHLFDSLAVAAVVQPELFELTPAYVEIDASDSLRAGTLSAWLPGRPSAWTRPVAEPNVTIATDFDEAGFTRLFRELVLAAL